MVQEVKAKDAEKRPNTSNTKNCHFGNLLAHPIKGGGGVVEGHSKASGLGEVFDLMLAPANFPLSQFIEVPLSR